VARAFASSTPCCAFFISVCTQAMVASSTSDAAGAAGCTAGGGEGRSRTFCITSAPPIIPRAMSPSATKAARDQGRLFFLIHSLMRIFHQGRAKKGTSVNPAKTGHRNVPNFYGFVNGCVVNE